MDKELKLFEDFISNYDMNNPKIKHKYDHTFRVVNYAKEISESINLDEKETNRALVCALFHDLGRFPQAKEYDTFIDKDSFDHGDKSYEILYELGYDDDVVKTAVKYHNKKSLPNFDEITDLHCKLVRDADKLDILDYFNKPIEDEEIIIPERAIEYFKNHELIDNSFVENKTVHMLRQLSFTFDVNFKRSMEIILDKNLLNDKLNFVRTNNTNKQIDFIEKELKEYIKERFDIIC